MELAFQLAPKGQPKTVQPRARLFSSGCLLCLKRRVKCDEARPGCQRCKKIGSQCPGYRNASELVFRDMNKSAEKNALGLRPPKARSKASEAKQSVVAKAAEQTSTIVPSIMPDIEHQSVCFFVDHFTLLPIGPRPGYLDFIPELYASTDGAPYFKDALVAVGMAALANQRHLDHLLPRARKTFGKALAGMHAALGSQRTAKSDHLLAASFLFSKYEMISGDSSELFESHNVGQLALLKLRGPGQMATPIGRSLFFLVNARATTRGLMEISVPPTTMNDLAMPAMLIRNPIIRLQHLLVSAIPPMAQARKLLMDPGSPAEVVRELAVGLIAIDQALQGWWEHMPPDLLPKYVPNDPLLYARGVDAGPYLQFLPTVFVFGDFLHTAMWSRYVSGRVQLLRILQLCVAHCRLHGLDVVLPVSDDKVPSLSPLPDTLATIESRLRTAVDQVCAAAPYMLAKLNPALWVPLGSTSPSSPPGAPTSETIQDFVGLPPTPGFGKALGPFFLMWTLYPAGLVTCISERQHRWIEDRLLDIGHQWGIRQALALRDNLQLLRAMSPEPEN